VTNDPRVSGSPTGTPALVTVPDHGDRIVRARKQRRPTGAPPPIQRRMGASGRFWLAMAAYALIVTVLLLQIDSVLHFSNRVETWTLLRIAELRADWLTQIMRGINAAGSDWGMTVLGLGMAGALMIFRRWRHLLVFLGALFAMQIVGGNVYELLTRPRPYGVTIIAAWDGFAMPSAPVAALVSVLIGITYTLVVPGRPRWFAKVSIAVAIALFAIARMYLAVDGPSDVLYGLILGVAFPLTAFRLFTPNEVFPVVYRKGSTAHLDVTGRRGESIRQAVRDQLGLTVLEIAPVGLAGSGGSTPLRIKVAGDPDTYLFAKLYAKSHVRADRWYKLSRTVLYGSLEDEAKFQSVRRFVQYEDHMLRLLRDEGLPVPAPHGIVEIEPEREYMILMEFFEGAEEIGEADVDEGVIDEGLSMVRRMWDAGLAHRDIKPANLMVRDGHLLLIDVFFVQVKPSPWRQAVDLGNMMLVLAVRSNVDLVYRRALRFFTDDEIAEAFAATRGIASPTQLRAFMKRDPRDLLGQFRALAPERRPIPIQRWSVRRVLLALWMLFVFGVAAYAGISAFLPAQNLGIPRAPECSANETTVLSAQAVPTAAAIPCLAALPSGWAFGGGDIKSGEARFWLYSDQAGERAVTVSLTAGCDVSGAHEVPSDEADTRRFEDPTSLTPLVGVRSYVFPGGCATYRFAFTSGASTALVFDVDEAVSFVPRTVLVADLRRREGLALCGRGAPCSP
jgi:tRNA A-37 threonylcarbamoyl transferase component Bud32/membrane-associated phospholipid phosphatase